MNTTDLLINPHTYSTINSFDLNELKANGIYRNKYDYELVYYYPPAKTLEYIKPDNVFPINADASHIKESLGLYVHIPFCTGHCSYCHYIRYINCKQEIVEQYLIALKRELELLSYMPSLNNSVLTNIHIGGGTPTFLDEYQITDLMNFIRKNYKISNNAEITWESSPETIISGYSNKLKCLLDNGVNRLNIGIQTFNDHLLKLCNRRHSAMDAEEAILTSKKLGFNNINIDVIYGLPDQNIEDWINTLDKVEELLPESVTVYHLRTHPDTKFAKYTPERFPTEEVCLSMQIYGYERLKKIGYTHLQPCQFGLSSQNIHHYVVDKWGKGGEFLGVGISSYGYINDCIYYNYRTMNSYLNAINANKLPIYLGRKLSLEQQMSKSLILGLKVFQSGVNQNIFKEKFGFSINEAFEEIISKLNTLGLIEVSSTSIKLSQKGILFSDEICTEFYTKEEKSKLNEIMATKYGSYLSC